MRPTNDKRIEELKIRRAQIDAELNRLNARARMEERKLDTRRKILIGALVLHEMETNQDLRAQVERLFVRLTKPRDRAVFGLESLSPGGG